MSEILKLLSSSSAQRKRERNHKNLINGSYDPSYHEEWEEFDSLSFDKQNNKLQFVIKRYIREPKITRYITKNYVKTPIYGDLKERSKVIMRFNKVINVEKFANEDILEMDLDKLLILDILNTIDVTPHWREKELKIEKINNDIESTEKTKRDYEVEKKEYDFKKTNYPDKHGKFWLRLAFALFTLGLSFIKYVTKKRAALNDIINKENIKYNEKHRTDTDKENDILLKEINKNNKSAQSKIDNLIKERTNIQNEEYQRVPEEDGWMMVKEASLYGFEELANLKGVYIIKNIDKNIYYVGQSKNMKTRLNQHFKNGDVHNIKFAKDWYNGDKFGFKYIVLDTKDELDSEEKRLIEYYDSFNNGYNATGGNI